MKSVSDRLAQEDSILREIRLTLSAVRATTSAPLIRKRKTLYASAPITSGKRLYTESHNNGFASTSEFRRALHDIFIERVFNPNLLDGQRFGEKLAALGWSRIIIPGRFFADGWTQEHYMSLWRQVITRHASVVALEHWWAWSLGCTEEFLIALQHRKQLLDWEADPFTYEAGLEEIRRVIDVLDSWGFDIKPHYELWRLGTLTVEAIREESGKTLKTS